MDFPERIKNLQKRINQVYEEVDAPKIGFKIGEDLNIYIRILFNNKINVVDIARMDALLGKKYSYIELISHWNKPYEGIITMLSLTYII